MAESKQEAKQLMQKIKGDKLMRQLAKGDRKEYRRLRRIANAKPKNGNVTAPSSAPQVDIASPEVYSDLPGLITSKVFDAFEAAQKAKNKVESDKHLAVAKALQEVLQLAFNARDGKRHLELVSGKRKSA